MEARQLSLIALDVDDVIASLMDRWLELYNATYNDNLRRDQLTNWHVEQFVVPECGLKIFDILGEPDLYEHVEMMPGALDGVNWLRGRGHEIIYVTACGSGMVDQKVEWLQRHHFFCPGVPKWEQVIIARRKDLIHVDLIVDDKLETCENIHNDGRKAMLMRTSQNNYGATYAGPDIADWSYTSLYDIDAYARRSYPMES
jgi:5'-nucleotidase